MAHDPINTGYARALLEMAQAENVVSRVQEELVHLGDLLRQNGALLQFLRDPNVQREGKRAALAELFANRVHPVLLNLLLTLNDQDRISRLPAIIEVFGEQADTSRQQASGEVITALPLDAAMRQRLEAELSRLTGKRVQLIEKVDPSILGGAILRVGEQVIDGSLRRKLDQIRESLAQ